MNIFPIVFTLSMFLSNIFDQDEMILFNGAALDNWEEIDFEEHGAISIADSAIIIGSGKEITGLRWKGDFPKTNYDLNLLAKRVEGTDFFCGITFPVKDSFLTLVLGGWGGSLAGLSCIDGYDAANNPTGILYHFASGWWYQIRLRVTVKKIEAWIENEKIVDFTINNSDLSLRWEVESSVPFGITTYKTTGAIKNIRVKMISE
jgi:hypothetical protein